MSTEAERLNELIVHCTRCSRLVAWRHEVAATKRASFADEDYWGRPITGFGDLRARVMVLGLAAGGPRREPDGSDLHRRPVGRLAVPRAAPSRLREPADVGVRRDDGLALEGLLRHRWQSGARPPRTSRRRRNGTTVCPTWSKRSACSGAPAGDRLPRDRSRGTPACARSPSTITLRSPGRSSGISAEATVGPYVLARLVSPEPAEHLHRQAHGAHARRGLRTRARTDALTYEFLIDRIS